MKNIIFIAPPAAGKGTQSILLREKYNLAHISTGDLLREASLEDSERGQYILNCLKEGNLVSDDITIELLIERLSKDDCKNGYILDGFPRTVEQAIQYETILKDLNKELGVVIFLDIPKEIALKRIVGRQVCPSCGAVFNDQIDISKPKIQNICDICGHELQKRKDDNETTFNIRFETYMKKTEPLIKHYEELGVLYKINEVDKAKAFKRIEEIIK